MYICAISLLSVRCMSKEKPWKWPVRLWFSAWVLCLIQVQVSSAQERDSLLLCLDKLPAQAAERAPVYNRLSALYRYENMDSASMYARKALAISEQNSLDKEKVVALKNLAIGYNLEGDNKNSIFYSEKALQLAIQLKDSLEMASLYLNSGVAHFDLGHFAQSAERYLMAEQVFEAIANYRGLGATYQNMASLFGDVNDYAAEERYLLKALAIKRAYGSAQDLVLPFLNMGVHFRDLALATKGILYLDSARVICIKNNKLELLGEIYSRISSCYTQLKQADSAMHYATLALESDRRHDMQGSLPHSLQACGEAWKLKGDLDRAVQYSLEAFRLSHAAKLYTVVYESSGLLAQCYKKLGKSSEALRFFEIYHNTQVELDWNEQRKQVAIMEYKQLLHKKEQESQLLQREKGEQEQKAKDQLFISISLAALLLVLILLSTLLFSLFRKYKSLSRQLDEKNKEIQEKNEVLAKLNQNKERMLSILFHDLKSPIATLYNILELVNDGELDREDVNMMMKDLSQQTNSTLFMLENLSSWAHEQLSSAALEPVMIAEWNQLLNTAIAPLLIGAREKQLHIQVDSRCQVPIRADVESCKLIVRNLVANAIKFSYPQGKIDIFCKIENSFLLTSIRDHGKGMDTQEIQKILEGNMQSSPGTLQEKGSGLGLKLCKEYIELNKGHLSIESQPGKGSTFSFSLPLYIPQENDFLNTFMATV